MYPITETDYRDMLGTIALQPAYDARNRATLAADGFSPERVEDWLAPARCFFEQMKEEVAWYERATRGEVGRPADPRRVGIYLIARRIQRGLSQGDLAERLGRSERDVARDEHNEYHGIAESAASRILAALES